jgi:hypothetical protein
MQDRYVGDVGDFAKYGLLRIIARETGHRLAVVWCRYANESHNSDGRHISYLRDPSFARLDPPLHASLNNIISRSKRTVRAVAHSGILPADTVYVTELISDKPEIRRTRPQRAQTRALWLRKALIATEGSQVVFFDPDNGIEVASVQRHSPKSGKYVFWDELMPFWYRGQSLLIYHHLNRRATVARQADILREKFAERFPTAALVNYFLFRRGSCRHFWLVGHEGHAEGLQRTIGSIAHSEWSEYFEVG